VGVHPPGKVVHKAGQCLFPGCPSGPLDLFELLHHPFSAGAVVMQPVLDALQPEGREHQKAGDAYRQQPGHTGK